MGDNARRETNPAAQSRPPVMSVQPQRGQILRSNFIEELIKAREAEHRTVRNIAQMAGVSPAAIKKLEAGEGPITTLVAVMKALPFQTTVLTPAASFSDQLKSRRAKIAKPLEVIAHKAGLAPEEIIELEGGGGSVENLRRLLSVIAPKVKRRAPERVYWSGDRKAERDSRFTPAEFLNSVYRAFGPISLDPCGHRSSPVVADRRFLLEEGDDGLTDPWSGRLAFVNPPYSGYLNWLQKAHDEWAAGNVQTVVCLVPVRTDSPLFQDVIKPKADLYFVRKRLHFGKEGGKPAPTPHSLMVVIFGATTRQKALFASLVDGFWAPTNDYECIPARSIVATARATASVEAYLFDATSCAAAVARNGRRPVRVFCGPSVRHRGVAR